MTAYLEATKMSIEEPTNVDQDTPVKTAATSAEKSDAFQTDDNEIQSEGCRYRKQTLINTCLG